MRAIAICARSARTLSPSAGLLSAGVSAAREFPKALRRSRRETARAQRIRAGRCVSVVVRADDGIARDGDSGVDGRAWRFARGRRGIWKKICRSPTADPTRACEIRCIIGTLTTAAGFVIASRRWELGVVFAAVFLLVYLPVVELEEQHLRKLFPDYAAYAARVPKLLPRLSSAGERERVSMVAVSAQSRI